jgi:uncharacterized protein YyaL (SSP411 family)
MNRLGAERSPYLRQHADNPVDWFPWGPEAFAKARDEAKPIFLSIGYSTCHWCHVMAHESFESPETAALLNEYFVPVKVDREERPDVDRVYMAYVQGLHGHGGWPLSAWLTPELKPFYGGTYFPPGDRGGRAGFPGILRAIARGWREERPRLLAEGERAVAALHRAEAAPAEQADDDGMAAAGDAFEGAFQYFHEAFDAARGGFGGAPKFPRAGNLAFLFRCAAVQGVASEAGAAAVRMAAQTLRQMARGGIHDQVGGGFHRYAVDADWFVPHFEKMLYDQAQIALNALEAWQATGDERHAWLARDILDYALRDLADPRGGFYSAEDADSKPAPSAGLESPAGASAKEGESIEGAFYVWTDFEIEAALAPEDAALVIAHFGVTVDGNVPAERDPRGEFSGRNILAQVRPLAETARMLGLDPPAANDRLQASLERLRAARGGRPRPHRDEKIIAAWNGLMISALARAAVVPAEALADRRAAYLAAAERAAQFLRSDLADPARGVLYRAGREGGIEGFAEDYAFCIQGLLDLYEAGFDLGWLQWAERLQAKMDELFWDEAAGGYFNSAAGAADIVARLKEDYDGAEPAPSSVAASNLLRLAAIFEGLGPPAAGGSAGASGSTGVSRARRTIAAFRGVWSRVPQALPQMLCALELAFTPPRHVVLVGDPGSGEFRALGAVLHERLGPRQCLVALDGGPAQAWLAERAPWLAAMRPVGGRATAYVCENFACRAPATAPAELRALLNPA